jgi:hypothetical protein
MALHLVGLGCWLHRRFTRAATLAHKLRETTEAIVEKGKQRIRLLIEKLKLPLLCQ